MQLNLSNLESSNIKYVLSQNSYKADEAKISPNFKQPSNILLFKQISTELVVSISWNKLNLGL